MDGQGRRLALDAGGDECGARTEPLLSAFCVGADGRVGERYEQVVSGVEGVAPVDIEMHAATQRVEAHRYHGATLPVVRIVVTPSARYRRGKLIAIDE